MCKERRATFQKTEMEENGTVHPAFSINFTKIQGVVSVAVGVTILLGSMVGAAAWTRSSIVEVAEETFKQSLEGYHTIMRPKLEQKIDKTIDQKLVSHEATSSKPIEMRLDSLDSRVTTLEVQGINVVKILDRHELLLLEILRRLPEHVR